MAYALLEVSATTYDEIAQLLRAAAYHHVFRPNGDIVLHGIGITRAPAPVTGNHQRRESDERSAPETAGQAGEGESSEEGRCEEGRQQEVRREVLRQDDIND